MNSLITALGYASDACQALLLILLLRHNSFRRYPLLLLYTVVILALTLIEGYVYQGAGVGSASWRSLYWRDEVITDFLLFSMVIGMTYRALEGSPLRAQIGRVLVLALLAVLVLPLILFRSPLFSSRWFYSTSQLLNFGAAIMNLALWTALLGNKNRDRRLLTVSAGLGIAVTGAAIGFGLAPVTEGTGRDLVDLFKTATHLVSLVIWCRAFWPAEKAAEVATLPLTTI